jgi:hypothetical protein
MQHLKCFSRVFWCDFVVTSLMFYLQDYKTGTTKQTTLNKSKPVRVFVLTLEAKPFKENSHEMTNKKYQEGKMR